MLFADSDRSEFMKKPNKSTMVAIAAVAFGLTAASVGAVHAASNTTSTNPMNSLVIAIAQKFNLNTTDVQQVFDDQHTQMEASRQEEFKTRLAQTVTDGKLTQDQADKIIAKFAELDSQRETNKTAMDGKTEAERRTAMQEQMTNLQQWATDNNIPMKYLPFGHGGHKGPRGGMGFGPR